MPGKTRLLRSLSLPKFPSISKGKTFNSGLDCIFENVDDAEFKKQPVAVVALNGKCQSLSKKGTSQGDSQSYCTKAGVQKYGILSKKSCRKNKTMKWCKRFFILKDSFLLYYDEDELKCFESKLKLNNHPKGIIPLGGCTVEQRTETSSKFILEICHEHFQNPVVLSTNQESDQNNWITCLKHASKITLKSAQLGDVMIKELESHGLRLHKERQSYVDRLQSEASALRDEIDKNESLELVKEELESEKAKLEQTAKELREELAQLKAELEETIHFKKCLENEKNSLVNRTSSLQNMLEALEMEKVKIKEEMCQTQTEKEKLSMENKDLSQASKILHKELSRIEAKSVQLMDEKLTIERKLEENFQKTLLLEDEKQYYSFHARKLMVSLSDLAAQKEMTEAELKEEIMARMNAEKHLGSAIRALEHMELALKLSGPHMTEFLKDEIMPDVRKLKRFFEDCAEEAKLDANKPVIMRNAINARKSFLRKCTDRVRNSIRRNSAPTPTPTKCDKILHIPIMTEEANNNVSCWYSRDDLI